MKMTGFKNDSENIPLSHSASFVRKSTQRQFSSRPTMPCCSRRASLRADGGLI